uniref:Uncharacterized protein n=2 Tax=Ditylum brightwellii TaxID=49249 RepID=A0A7S4RIT9_9STRA
MGLVAGSGGSGNALASFERMNNFQGVMQELASECFKSVGDMYEITAKFRLTDADGIGAVCTPSEKLAPGRNACPTVRINAKGCTEAPVDEIWINVWNDIDFTAWDENSFNDFHASFYVDSMLASCSEFTAVINGLDASFTIIVDDFSIGKISGEKEVIEEEVSDWSAWDNTVTTESEVSWDSSVTTAISCPDVGTTSDITASGITLFENSNNNVLCKLILVDASGTLLPIARSYENNNWEMSGGDFARTLLDSGSFPCQGSQCQINLPENNYKLISYTYELPNEDKVARLLESVTFGPKWSEVSAWTGAGEVDDTSVESYIRNQMDAPMTSHREYFRKRLNPRYHHVLFHGAPDHPCSPNSRWRKFAFSWKDGYVHYAYEKIMFSSHDNDKYVVKLEKSMGVGEDFVQGSYHLRTVVEASEFPGVVPGESYTMCKQVEEWIGGSLWLSIDGVCTQFANPEVNLAGYEDLLENEVIDLGEFNSFNVIDEALSQNAEFIYTGTGITGPACDSYQRDFTEFDGPIFGKTSDGTWLQFDPRLQLEDNTPENKIMDGGLSLHEESGYVTGCSVVPRSHFNDGSCVFKAEPNDCSNKGGFICGSPGEIANDPTIGNVYDFGTGLDTVNRLFLANQREQVWTMVALHSEDQLRQRVAHALSQILVIVKDALRAGGLQSESFLIYYDILVKHAFGNYRDILEEITFNPLMGENLSYLSSKSAQYMRERWGTVPAFPDENYAREFMQLFTIGYKELGLDGIPKVDDNGDPVLTYTNDEIMSFARAWTGFERHEKRSNVEDGLFPTNHIDPMYIEPTHRDNFPKSDVQGGYIGDGYPLCVDLPEKMFLNKGAKYRFLGTSRDSDMGGKDIWEGQDNVVNILTLSDNSELKAQLVNYANDVTLDSNLGCTDAECRVDTVRVVKVGEFYYEYIRPACVEQAFYDGAKKLMQERSSYKSVCANPALPVALGACCSRNFLVSDVTYNAEIYGDEYDSERTTYYTAEARCEAVDKITCDFDFVVSGEYNKGFHWTDEPCKIRVKIDEKGNVAPWHLPSNILQTMAYHVDEDNANYFKAYWDGDLFPEASQTCGGCDAVGSTCVCDADVRKYQVFRTERLPTSTDEVLSTLHIGSIDPETYGATYSTATIMSTVTNETITVYNKGDSLDEESIFQVEDNKGRVHFLKNMRETVHLLKTSGEDSSFSFRNAPHFNSIIPQEAAARDAHYETQAVSDHFFYHPNTAPMLAYRIIQRFGISNPSPRYVRTVSEAFISGEYKNFGSSMYGCLEATIAAALLDREARSVILGADPFHGALKEPLLKVIGVMRSMEFEAASSRPSVTFTDMYTTIGMMAHSFPSVFGFYEPSFKSNGAPGKAGLVSPESALLDMSNSVNIMNGIFSLARYGLSECYGGFGKSATKWNFCNIGNYEPSSGTLTYHPEDYVSKLSTLLTAGRLSQQSKGIISNAAPEFDVMHALSLIVTSPEFHSTSVSRKSGTTRQQESPPSPSGKQYKALVYIMLSGGCDSFNVLVPHSGCAEGKDLYQEYFDERGGLPSEEALGGVALPLDELLQINVEGQVCSTFGLHPSLSGVDSLYKSGELLFFANAGVITQPSTKSDYFQKTKTALFTHDTMQREAKRLNPFDRSAQTGVMGRMADVMTEANYNLGSFAIDWQSEALSGEPGKSPPPTVISQKGTTPFNPNGDAFNMMEVVTQLNEATSNETGVFAEQWSADMLSSLQKNALLDSSLSSVVSAAAFPDNHLGRQLKMVSHLIQTREERGVDRDLFFVEMKGFDTHHSSFIGDLLSQYDSAVGAFADELKILNVWNDVTTIQLSDFARTLAPNSGGGTDHGWGGNYMMFGGNVAGGKVKGEYPDNFTPEGSVLLDRGRFLPTTAWDSVFKVVAEWYGVPSEKLNDVCPNAHMFENEPAFNTFGYSDLFIGARRQLRGGNAV